ncbi:Maf family protein [Candidatus Leptofilum sp.]|uniref:Maf family protein n=1 Tax=Candidatus Leptofilum sp. TaxID=3241576 RepID=UPI003B5C304C
MVLAFFTFNMALNIILASQSPRRRELLQLLGLPFRVMVADANEDSITHPDPATNVVQTAYLKSSIIASQLIHSSISKGTFILAADTTVAHDGVMLNKPADETAAWQMLTRLRNNQHEVHTGFVLLEPATGYEWQGVSTAVVTMRPYSDAEIQAYIASGDPFDKAGGYAIQHPEFRPVAQLDGCYCTVMGLPICDLIVALQQFQGISLAQFNRLDLTAVSRAHHHYSCPTLQTLMH